MKTTHRFAVALLFVLTLFPAFCARAQWIQSARDGNIAYFLFQLSARLERYSLSEEQWLSPIELPTTHGLPTIFCADESGIYVAYNQTVKRYDSQGGNETHLMSTLRPVLNLFTDGALLLVNNTGYYNSLFTSLNKTNGAVIDTFEYYYNPTQGASIAPSINKVFGRNYSEVVYLSYNDDGTFIGAGESAYNYDYPTASRTWVFPDDSKVVDDSGIAYSTDTLTYRNSFAENIDDLAFQNGNIPIVLQGTNLILFSDSAIALGRRGLSSSPGRIYVEGSNVFTFTSDNAQANGIFVEKIAIDSITPPQPGAPVDPNGLNFVPNHTFIDTNRVLYLFSKTNESLFRWDTVNQRYLETIPLLGSPDYCVYSEANHKVYLAYPSRAIRQIDLSDTNFSELPFVNLATTPIGLSTAGQYLFAIDASGFWGTHYTFAPGGELIVQADRDYYSAKEFTWSEANQKMYFFQGSDSSLMWEQINANGTAYPDLPAGGIGVRHEAHWSETGFLPPIRLSPDGSIVVLGSGAIFNAATLKRVSVGLTNSVTDVAWVNGKLRSIRALNGGTELQQWNAPNLALGSVRQLRGVPHRLLALETNRLIAISIVNSKPSFHVMNGAFVIEAPAVLETPFLLDPGIGPNGLINLAWQDVSGEESYSVERSTGTNGNWIPVGTTAASVTSFQDGPFALGSVYYYRVTAHNGDKSSLPSAVVLATVALPSTPVLALSAVSSDSVTLSWDDIQYETSYAFQYKHGVNGAWIDVATLWRNVTRYTVTDLTPDSLYFFRIKAINGLGSSSFSTAVSATTDAVLPTAPFLYLYDFGAYYISLDWYYYDKPGTGYVLERRTLPDSNWEIMPQVTGTSYTDQSVSPSTDYEYRIYATNRVGSSDYSEIVSVKTQPEPPPEAPWNLIARSVSAEAVVVSWRDVRGEDGYVLQRSTPQELEWADLVGLSTNITRYVDTDVIAGGQYFYRVKAFNEAGGSDYSYVADATVLDFRYLIEDTFDPALNPLAWSEVAGGIVTNGGKGFLDGNALWFGGAGTRQAATIPLNLRAGGYLNFSIRAGNQQVDGVEFWEDSEWEYITIEYSIEDGEWQPLKYMSTIYTDGEWTDYSIPILPSVYGPQTRLRWRQWGNRQQGLDPWALENVSVQSLAPPPPAAPSFVIASPGSGGSITVLWTGVIGATSYFVERADNNQTWTRIAQVSSVNSYYIDFDVVPSKTYFYRVIASNVGGESPASYTVSSMLTARLTVNSNPADAGTVVLDPPQPDEGYPFGTIVTVTAYPSGTNVFSAWYGAKTTMSREITITMNGNLHLTALYNNNGKLIFQDPATGKIALWFMEGSQRLGSVLLNDGEAAPPLVGVGDFTRDNSADLLFRTPEGTLAMTVMNGNVAVSNVLLRGGIPLKPEWKWVGSGDFNNDQMNDLVWFNSVSRRLAVWFMNDTTFSSAGLIREGLALGSAWRVVTVGDFNGDGNGDFLLQRSTGETAIWVMTGTELAQTVVLRNGLKTPNWKTIAAGDFNGDSSPDILFQNADRKLVTWYMQGTNYLGNALLNNGNPVGSTWRVRGVK